MDECRRDIVDIRASWLGGCKVISEADVQKLLTIRASGPSVLSLYLWVPLDLPDLRALPARADELFAMATESADDQRAVKARRPERLTARELLELHARDWLGHTVAVFVCHEAGLTEAFPLPCQLPERAVLALRPHVRPLLVALQRCPAYQVAVVDRQHAWIFQVADTSVETVAQQVAQGVRSAGFGGWYGLESYRVSERINQLARHHYRDTAAILRQTQAVGWRPLVVGGHEEEIPAFVAVLPGEVRERIVGRFVVDPHTMTPARVRELSAPVVANWLSRHEQQLVSQVLAEPPNGLTAIGLNSVLAAVNQHAAQVLILPVGGLIPGFACEVCGWLASTPDSCSHGPSAAHAVPDLLEEMAVATRADGGEVDSVFDLPGDVAARLRFPLTGAATG